MEKQFYSSFKILKTGIILYPGKSCTRCTGLCSSVSWRNWPV